MEKDLNLICEEVSVDCLESWLRLAGRSIIIEDGHIKEVVKD